MRTLTEKEIRQLKDKMKIRGTDTLKTVIYARKSAEDDTQTSLPTQVDCCKKAISAYEFLKLTAIYTEDNRSGMFTDNRAEFLAMIKEIQQGNIDVVVVLRLDRLARDLADSATTIKLLNAYGCFLYAGNDVSEQDTASGEFLRNILLAQNQYHARQTASSVMNAECHNATQGTSTGGIPPYGLKVVAKRFEIDETEAPAIRIMFDKIARGYSYKNVIDELTSLGYRTRKRGKIFLFHVKHTAPQRQVLRDVRI